MLQIAREMVRLENELAVLRAEFDRLTQDGPSLPVDRGAQLSHAELTPRPLARTSAFPQRIQSVLDLSSKPLTAHDIASLLQEPGSVDTIRAVLSKLLARGGVERVAVGLYRSTIGGHRSAAGDDD